jgi:hypothetical protein
MTDRPNSVDDGLNYLSRVRVNRHVITFAGADLQGVDTINTTLNLNGRIQRIIVDATRATQSSTTANDGTLTVSMDLEDDSGNEYTYFNPISGLDFRASSGAVYHFQTSEGAAMRDGTGTNAIHLAVSPGANAAHTSAAIDSVMAWTGLVCGQVRFKLDLANDNWGGSSGDVRIVIIMD